jgi:hypothetical protein
MSLDKSSKSVQIDEIVVAYPLHKLERIEYSGRMMYEGGITRE